MHKYDYTFRTSRIRNKTIRRFLIDTEYKILRQMGCDYAYQITYGEERRRKRAYRDKFE
jgi:hypothetical protein